MGIFDIFKKPATDKNKADVYVEENCLKAKRVLMDHAKNMILFYGVYNFKVDLSIVPYHKEK